MKKKKASPITKLIKGLGGLYKSFFAATYLTYLAPGKQVGSFITIAILPRAFSLSLDATSTNRPLPLLVLAHEEQHKRRARIPARNSFVTSASRRRRAVVSASHWPIRTRPPLDADLYAYFYDFLFGAVRGGRG